MALTPAAANRAAALARLAEAPEWDMLVIGGGATGLGCAVDAAARGYKVLLVEAQDFAKGTSSRATKLVHGGVRYLAQGNLPLVREALAERARLLANAPHLVHPLRFVVPSYRRRDTALLAVGLSAYDLLAGQAGIARSRVLDVAQTRAALPTVKTAGLRGGIAYWDAQFDDARLALALARTLEDLGGLALNYCAVTGLVVEGDRLRGAVLQEVGGRTFEAAARVVINATGVWADSVRRLVQPATPPLLRPSQGIHLVLDRSFLPGADALLVPRTADGRVLFMIPWQGRLLLGTTDSLRADLPLEPQPLPGEVDFVLDTAAAYLERPPRRQDVRSQFAGLRPLIGGGMGNEERPTGGLSREHLIEVSATGLVSVLGGKWTTYRHMAEEAVDRALAVAGLPRRASATAAMRLHGAREGDDPYGSDREAVNALPGAGRRLQEGLTLTEAEVRYAARAEYALSVEDVLARRHRALFVDASLALEAAPAVAALLAEELGRDGSWEEAQLRAFAALAQGFGVA